MEKLSKREREFVAIGAAIASNCIGCIIYHIKESKKIGITNDEIKEAVELSEKVKKVPAKKILDTAYAQLKET